MIKMSIHQKDIKVINLYAPNKTTSKYMKQKLTKLNGQVGNSTIIVLEFNVIGLK